MRSNSIWLSQPVAGTKKLVVGCVHPLEAPKTMKFAVKSWSSGARTGLLQLRGRPPVDTPCLLLGTRKGLPHFIPADLLESLHPDAVILQTSPLHFLESPSAEVISAIGGIHSLSSLSGYVLVALARDSTVHEPDGEGSNKLGASFETFAGRRLVGPDVYMELVNALSPDIWASLPDEVPTTVTLKRNTLSVDRTLRWLDHCLSLRRDNASSPFGVVVGGLDVEERKRCAVETSRRDVAGFSLGGFGLGETFHQRAVLLEAAVDHLPSTLPRHISGIGLPEEILQGVSFGIDMFDSTYPYALSTGGFAMTFSLHMGADQGSPIVENAKIGADSAKINLRSVSYRYDRSPVLEGCPCYCCRKHTRAYLNHLLNTHEMLAQILLDIHNYYHYLRFFKAIRDAISANRFEQFRTWFMREHSEVFQYPEGLRSDISNTSLDMSSTISSLKGLWPRIHTMQPR